MKLFSVLKPGLFTTVQDLGRYGYLRFGVPISGAMDQFSLVAANVLVGNKSDDACLETTIMGPELQALGETQVAVTGANCSPRINGEDVPMWRTLQLQKDDVVSFRNMHTGCRAYLSIRGGVNTPLVLGSRSTYVRGGFGGLEGRRLRGDDVIEGFDVLPPDAGYSMPKQLVPRFSDHVKVRAVLGPQAEMFTERGVSVFFSGLFRVSADADRMGYRLEGLRVELEGKADIVSDALLPGAVQIPKDAKPIIIMRDAQTTGGYPKIAVAIAADLSVLGQLKPGCSVTFFKVTLREAEERTREFFRLLKDLSSMLIRDR
jgi:antagonist of KipI